MEKSPLLPENEARRKTRRVHLSMCIIMLIHFVSTTIESLVVSEYTYQYVSENLQGNHSHVHLKSVDASSNENCSAHKTEAQHDSAEWNSYYVYAEYVPCLLVVVWAGIMSDYLGRKPFIILTLLGTFLKTLATLTVVQYSLDIKYIFVGCLLGGLTGSHYTLDLSFCGVVADVSNYDKSRTFTLALLHLYSGLGSAVAQMSTGYMIRDLGFAIPCLVSVSLCFLNFLVGLYIPESLSNTNRKPNNDDFCEKLQRFFAFYTNSSNLREGKVWQFVLCLLSLTLVTSPLTTRMNIDIMYLLGQPFCFTSEQIGWFNSANNLVSLCVSVLVLKLLHLCMNDEIITVLSCVSGIVCFAVEAFASVWWMLYVAAGIGVLAVNPLPVVRGIMSRLVSESRQAQYYGQQKKIPGKLTSPYRSDSWNIRNMPAHA
ncbi:proton-coupled folate transporter-like isoform X3 [Crassostrea virginica]